MTDTPKAGAYLLLAQWDEITSKPNEPLNYTRHRPGDEVHLDEATAKRLVKAGAAVNRAEHEKTQQQARQAAAERAFAQLSDEAKEQILTRHTEAKTARGKA